MSATASTSKIAIVTGANQGIGYGIARRLATLYPSSHFGSTSEPLTVYFTARNVERGQASFSELSNELSSTGSKILAKDGGLTTLKFHQLDIDDPKSRSTLKNTIQQEEGGLDLLINNAGIALDGFNADVVKKTLHTNYYSTKDLTEELLPLLKKGGRVVVRIKRR